MNQNPLRRVKLRGRASRALPRSNADIAQRRALSGDEAAALLRVVQKYASALDLLEYYDQHQLPETAGLQFGGAPIHTHEARQAIQRLRGHFNAGPLCVGPCLCCRLYPATWPGADDHPVLGRLMACGRFCQPEQVLLGKARRSSRKSFGGHGDFSIM